MGERDGVYWESEILPDGRQVECGKPGVEYDFDCEEYFYFWDEKKEDPIAVVMYQKFGIEKRWD